MQFRFTEYFETEVMRKRPYLKKEWCIAAVANPLRSGAQENNRWRFLGGGTGTRRVLLLTQHPLPRIPVSMRGRLARLGARL